MTALLQHFLISPSTGGCGFWPAVACFQRCKVITTPNAFLPLAETVWPGYYEGMIQLTREAIDTAGILQQAGSNLAGAVVLFLGVTREVTGDAVTKSLEYECYEDMALSELNKLEQTARDRWPITGCVIVHRLGQVDIQQASVAIAVSSPHRKAAFEAGQWLIDTLKETVPIWKKEQWATGGEEWVHPVTGQPQPDFQPESASSNSPEQAS